EDEARDRNQRNHEQRDASIVQDLDGGHQLKAGCGSLRGVELDEIFRKFIQAEFETDWEKARLEHGRAAGRTIEETNTAFDRFRCSTLDGRPVDPPEAVAAGLAEHVRRAVVGADSVTIDFGRTRRLFSGPAAIAAKLASTTCYRPGCHVRVTDCEIDHLRPYVARAGPTDQANAGPACQRHNRFKEARTFTVWRDPIGEWIIERPDGTRLE
ncbi:MAG: HNH endonuclease signature motif containing protein, partial [Actinomycetota bacterium]|nr:HNH endonuclease signature motif containing protein [Actinomycetota bacterium]